MEPVGQEQFEYDLNDGTEIQLDEEPILEERRPVKNVFNGNMGNLNFDLPDCDGESCSGDTPSSSMSRENGPTPISESVKLEKPRPISSQASERNSMVSERSSRPSERNSKPSERNSMVSERNSMVSERSSRPSERNSMVSERKSMASEINDMASEINSMVSSQPSERNSRPSERKSMTSKPTDRTFISSLQPSERSSRPSERNSMVSSQPSERNSMVSSQPSERNSMISERNSMVSERNSMVSERKSEQPLELKPVVSQPASSFRNSSKLSQFRTSQQMPINIPDTSIASIDVAPPKATKMMIPVLLWDCSHPVLDMKSLAKGNNSNTLKSVEQLKLESNWKARRYVIADEPITIVVGAPSNKQSQKLWTDQYNENPEFRKYVDDYNNTIYEKLSEYNNKPVQEIINIVRDTIDQYIKYNTDLINCEKSSNERKGYRRTVINHNPCTVRYTNTKNKNDYYDEVVSLANNTTPVTFNKSIQQKKTFSEVRDEVPEEITEEVTEEEVPEEVPEEIEEEITEEVPEEVTEEEVTEDEVTEGEIPEEVTEDESSGENSDLERSEIIQRLNIPPPPPEFNLFKPVDLNNTPIKYSNGKNHTIITKNEVIDYITKNSSSRKTPVGSSRKSAVEPIRKSAAKPSVKLAEPVKTAEPIRKTTGSSRMSPVKIIEPIRKTPVEPISKTPVGSSRKSAAKSTESSRKSSGRKSAAKSVKSEEFVFEPRTAVSLINRSSKYVSINKDGTIGNILADDKDCRDKYEIIKEFLASTNTHLVKNRKPAEKKEKSTTKSSKKNCKDVCKKVCK